MSAREELAHEEYAQWDAAYVLGALSVADRRDYEDHLHECAECRRAVAELGPAVGLLARLDPDAVAAMAESPAAPESLVATGDMAPRAVAAPPSTPRRRLPRLHLPTPRMWAWGAGVLVAVAVVIAVPVALTVGTPPGVSYTLKDVGAVPLAASVRLSDADWGTRIQLDCSYPASARGGDLGWEYQLAVIARGGQASTVSTWRAYPGSEAQLSAATALSVSDITAVEIRAADGTVVMRADVSQQRG